jgi:hypothetical protein
MLFPDEMMSGALRIRGLIALAILAIFLGAELHFLADLDSDAVGSHVCPVCAALSSTALPPPPSLVSLPLVSQAREALPAGAASSGTFRFVSLRAPPRG